MLFFCSVCQTWLPSISLWTALNWGASHIPRGVTSHSFFPGFCFTAGHPAPQLCDLIPSLFSPPTQVTLKDKWCHFLHHARRPGRRLRKWRNYSVSINACRQDRRTWIYFGLVKTLTMLGGVNSDTPAGSVQAPGVALPYFYDFKPLRVTPLMQPPLVPPAGSPVTTSYFSTSLWEIPLKNKTKKTPAILTFRCF